MPDPTFDHIDHGVESWDGIFNDNMDKVTNNLVRSTKSAAHGQMTYLDHAEAISPALAGASYTFAGLIPAGCILLGVTTRVTTLVTGATAIDTGDGSTVDEFGHHSALALGTTTNLADHKAGAVPKLYLAAGDVVLTAVTANFTGGTVRVTAHILRLTPPTG